MSKRLNLYWRLWALGLAGARRVERVGLRLRGRSAPAEAWPVARLHGISGQLRRTTVGVRAGHRARQRGGRRVRSARWRARPAMRPATSALPSESARRLLEDEGVHAIVGPNSSAASLRVAEELIGPASVPDDQPVGDVAAVGLTRRTTISSSARRSPTAPRARSSARVTRERGFTNVGLLYRDDPYGQGLAAAFESAWDRDHCQRRRRDPARRRTCRWCGRARARTPRRSSSSISPRRRRASSARRSTQASTTSSFSPTPRRG